MFFREKKTPSGRVTQLVYSYRNAQGSPRQYIVASLGDLVIPKKIQRAVATEVERRLRRKGRLLPGFEPPPEVARFADQVARQAEREGRWPPPDSLRRRGQEPLSSPQEKASEEETPLENGEIVDGVLVDRVDHGKEASLGCVLLGWKVWRDLEMDSCLERLGFSRLDRAAAMALAINRLDDPASEHAMPSWLSRSALPDLVPIMNRLRTDDRFYRAGDRLLEHKDAIEAHLCRRQREALHLRRTLILYDLTNTHFEGVCAANPKAKRGKNKQKRDDCPQVAVGMLFDEHGFELGHKIFAGNRNEGTTLPEMIEEMKKLAETRRPALFGKEEDKPAMVVMDAGLATKENLKALQDAGIDYLVNETRSSREQWAEIFADEKSFRTIRTRGGEPLLVRKEIMDIPGFGLQARLFCKSAGRKAKELAIRTRAEERFLRDLEALAKRVREGRLKKTEKIQAAIGRLQNRHKRVSRFYRVIYTPPNNGEPIGRLTWTREGEAPEEDPTLGGYVLRTPRRDMEDKLIWATYTMLTVAESGFKSVKGLGLRPNYHEIEPRVDAHIFITILAYHLLSHIRYRLRRAGDRREWKTLKPILKQHTYATIYLPTRRGDLHRIRKPGRPEPQQQEIYDRLGVDLAELPVRKDRVKIQ